MYRKYHKLRENKSSQYPLQYIFFDTETERIKVGDDQFDHRLKLGWLNYVHLPHGKFLGTDDWFFFTSVDQFWDYIDNLKLNKSRILLFAHNIDFDLQVLDYMNQLSSRGYEVKKVVLDNRFILQCRKSSKTLLFLDMSNYVGKVPLAKVAKSIGMEKLSVDFETSSEDELSVYCKRDVEIVRSFVLSLFQFMKDNDLGHFGPTVASLAFNTFCHKFMHHDIYIHNYDKISKLERESYRGGRVEAFFIGKLPNDQNYYLVDVNSMYPFVMRENLYPTRFLFSKKFCTLRLLYQYLSKFFVIASVNITINEPAIGVKKEKLIFPVGTFDCVLCSSELEYVKKHGKINKIYQVAVYQQAPIFKNYVDYFYNKRKEYLSNGNQVNSLFIKLLLNSLYGKFGQQIRKAEVLNSDFDTDITYMRYKDLVNQESGVIYKIGNQYIKEHGKYESYNSFPAISSAVTANARMYLWQLIKTAGRENVFYCDTDSLIVNEKGFANLSSYISDEKILGKLSLETYSNELEIRGAKMYKFGDRLKIKGVKNPNSFKKEFTQTQFVRTKTAISKNIRGIVREKIVKKVLSYVYDKGHVSDSGRVEPFTL